MSRMNIQPGHIARHTPKGAGSQGREAAVIDIAQDLLLAHMHGAGLLDGLAIKGGTAIRKLYADKEGRFSLDLDFAEIEEGAGELFIMEADGLEIWVDTCGMHAAETHWRPALQGSVFDPERWLRQRREDEFDLEDIGALAVPKPTAEALSDAVRKSFTFLGDLDEDEAVIARSDERDRSLVIKTMAELPQPTFDPAGLY